MSLCVNLRFVMSIEVSVVDPKNQMEGRARTSKMAVPRAVGFPLQLYSPLSSPPAMGTDASG